MKARTSLRKASSSGEKLKSIVGILRVRRG
jgi:hypothetical protein